MNKIKKGDSVIVISGKDKGKKRRGCSPTKQWQMHRISYKYGKKNIQNQTQMPVLKEALWKKRCQLKFLTLWYLIPYQKKQDRVGFKTLESGKKVRIYKSNKEVIDI